MSIFKDGCIKRLKSTSGFRFGDCTHMRRLTSISTPKFDLISQSTAEIELLAF